uniref:Mannosyltransferase n=1 Tax=Macrostomum lignano TaxID=282301 RepID=A0A1I8F7S4_9PLAT
KFFSVQHALSSEAVIIHQEVRQQTGLLQPPEDLRRSHGGGEAEAAERGGVPHHQSWRENLLAAAACRRPPPSRPVMSGGGGNSLSAAASAGRCCSHASAYVRSRPVGRSARAPIRPAGRRRGVSARPAVVGPEATKEDRDAAIEPSETVGPEPLRRSLLTRARPVPVAGGVPLRQRPAAAHALCADEFWQSVEVAHRSAFGYGHLTWEWQAGLRSPLYPGAFALLFKLLQLAGADSRLAVAKLPRLLQACLAAVADFYLYRFSRRVAAAAQWALICQLLNWFTLYTAPRTLSNCVEWLLTTVGLYYYPWPEAQSRKAQWKFALAVAAACALRPTSRRRRLGRLLALYGATGLLVLAVSGLADKHYYGRWTLSQLNFLHYNLLSDIGSFYGVHPWHWYITQGIPAILGPHLPLYLYASYQSWRQRRRVETALTLLVIWTLYVYSHAPPTPQLPGPQGVPLRVPAAAADDAPVRPLPQRARPALRKAAVACLCCLGIPAALYFCLIHQRGPLDAVNHLGKDAELRLTRTGVPAHLDPDLHFLFLAPCHSTPLYSHLHSKPLGLWTARPTGGTSRATSRSRRPSTATPPASPPACWTRAAAVAHPAVRLALLPRLRGLLETRGFTLRKKFFNSHFEDGRRSHYLLLFCRSDWV